MQDQNLNDVNAVAITLNTNAAPDYSLMESIDGHALFPTIFEIPGCVQIKRRKFRHPDCILSNPNYVPDPEIAKIALIWMLTKTQEMSLGFQGHTGTGKTEMVLFLADKLNLPVYITKIHGRMLPCELEGSYVLRNVGGVAVTEEEFGPATKAYLNGGILLLDEFDKASAELTSSLHLLVEGKPWPLEQFKKTITKHPQCFVMGTANTFGGGHDERYISSNQLDQAFLSRFAWLETKYPTPKLESQILANQFPRIPEVVRKMAIELANALRDAALGKSRDGNVDDPIQAVFSTRVLVSWFFYMQSFGARPLKVSLDFVFLKSVSADDKEIVNDIITKVVGDELNKNIKDFMTTKKP